MRYIIHYNELVELERTQMQLEIDQLTRWLHTTEIDPEFDPELHLYKDSESGDRWLHLPELTERQLLAMQLILSSSEVTQR
jgi:hypothetical protein